MTKKGTSRLFHRI